MRNSTSAAATRASRSSGSAEFARWFDRLEADFDLLAREPERHIERPVLLQNALIDALDVSTQSVRALRDRAANPTQCTSFVTHHCGGSSPDLDSS